MMNNPKASSPRSRPHDDEEYKDNDGDSLNDILDESDDDNDDLVSQASYRNNNDNANESLSDESSNSNSNSNTNSNDESLSMKEKPKPTSPSAAPNTDMLLLRLTSNEPALIDLTIDAQTLTRHSAVDIVQALRSNHSLQKLKLHGLEVSQFQTIVGAFKNNTSIRSLDVFHAIIDRQAATAFANALASAKKNNALKRICISNCDFLGSALAVLFLGLQHTHIEHLAVESSSLGGYAADVVSASLPLMKLQSLRLRHTSITLDGLRFLFTNLEMTPSLTGLDLSQAVLTVPSVRLLIASLPSWRVERLALVDCGLDHICVGLLSNGLVANTIVKRIDVSRNGFGDQGALHWKELLSHNHVIQELCLDECHISNPLLASLKDGLRYNNSFLKNMFSTQVSLAILDSVQLMERISESF